MTQDSPGIGPRPAGPVVAEDAVPGTCPPGSVLLHAPSFAFQSPGGGENQLVQTGRHLEAPRRHGPAVLALDRPAGRGAAAPPVRDVARGAGAGPRARGRGTSAWSSRRSAGIEPRALAALAPTRRGRLAGLAAWSPAADCARAGPAGGASCSRLADADPAQLARPRPASSSGSSASTRGGSASCPTASLPRVRARPARRVPRRSTAPATSSSSSAGSSRGRTSLGLIRAVEALGLPLVVIGDGPAGCRGLRRAVPAPRAATGPLARARRPRRPAAGLGLRGGPGLRPAELVRDARAWPRSRRRWRAAPW